MSLMDSIMSGPDDLKSKYYQVVDGDFFITQLKPKAVYGDILPAFKPAR
jgi:hypothetical protein